MSETVYWPGQPESECGHCHVRVKNSDAAAKSSLNSERLTTTAASRPLGTSLYVYVLPRQVC